MRVVLVAIALLVGGCGTTTTTPDPAATSAGSLVPDACPVGQPPGPDDEPSTDGEVDTTDQAGGRAAVCLIGSPALTWASTAWCTWTPDRIAVEAVSGLPTPVAGDPGDWDAFLDLRAGRLEVSRTAPDGTVTTWVHDDVPAAIRDDGTDGLATFDAALDPGSAPAAPPLPPRLAGLVRWQCAAPPAP